MESCSIGSDGFYHPRSEGDVMELIAKARREGRVIRARGSGHSVLAAIYSDAGQSRRTDPGGINLMLDQLREVTFDDANMRVTAQAGCNLGRDPSDPTGTSTLENSLFYQLHRRGWAFPDTGGIIHQTVSGFLGTGSSGGSLHHSVGDQIVELQLIDGLGRKHVLSERQDRERFLAAGVSMGLLGIVVAVTFQCVPAFQIIGEESTTSEDDCAIDLFGSGSGRPSLEEFCRQHEHVRLMWWPQAGVRRVVTWYGRRMNAEELKDPRYSKPEPYRQFPMILRSSLPAQLFGGCFYYGCRFWNHPGLRGKATRGFLRLALVPVIKMFAPKDGSNGPKRFWGPWWHVLPMDNEASDRLFPTSFTEMWIPLSETTAVLRRLRDHYRTTGFRATGTYACEIYATKPSRFWMSPGYQREVVKIDMFWYGRNVGDPCESYYPQFWDLLRDFEYRFHWGKYLSSDSASYLKSLYPEWDSFMRMRSELDPEQVFVSPYWRKHLGIPLKGSSSNTARHETDTLRLWGRDPDGRFNHMIELLDRHMVAENAGNIPEILETLVAEPRFTMEYMPFSLGTWSWFTRKRWNGQAAVAEFYRGFFHHFRSLHITPLSYTVSAKGVVHTYRLKARVFGIPVTMRMAAVFDYVERERKFMGERVYFSQPKALAQIRPEEWKTGSRH
jgi:hypothetical protein